MEANQVQPVPSSNAGVAACMIVPEVLKEDNYERWCIFMQHYLVAQDLWDVVLSSEMPHGEDSREWIKRNALALHTIKISCGAKMFEGIKEMNSAKDAWNALADLHKQPNEHGNKDTGIETVERKQACVFVQSNTGVAACLIVPEVLKEDNYEWWRIFMEHYLVAQDLWDVLLGEDRREWIKRNALALHAIKISCGAEQFDRIKKMNIAKDAWNALAASHKQPNEDGNKDTGIRTVERKQAVTLLKDIKKGDFDAVMKDFETYPRYSAALENGSTALHVAITTGKTELAKKLISVMSENELETQDKSGKTVLSLAACKGSRNIVECLVGKNKKLLEIPDCEKKIPLVLACARQHKSLTRYLYTVTCKEFLDPAIGDHGFFLLKECIRNKMFDIGLDLLRKFPNLTFHTSSLEPTPIILLLVEVLSPVFNRNKLLLFCRSPRFDYLKHARELVFFICDQQLSTLERDQFMSSGAVEATFKAIKLGYLDFVKQITEANPDIVWSRDPEHSRDMLMYAVAHRQHEIAQFLWGLNAWKNMTECTIDDDQNNMLHLAAKLDPSHPYIHDISDPLLRMQSEARWFKEVKRIVPKFYREQRNKDGETPLEVFRREHQGFLEEAQTWVKDTVNFATVISTLIIGIMFAASITFPGGNNDRDGFPIFSKRSSFNDFLRFDLASVVLASLSVLLFLDIHKSSLTEEAFLSELLILKLVLSFYSLFYSIGCMLICFFISIDLVDPKALSPLPLTAVVYGGSFIRIFQKQLLPFFKILRFRIFRTESMPSCLIVYGHFFQRTET